jgi:hypothetical protein
VVAVLLVVDLLLRVVLVLLLFVILSDIQMLPLLEHALIRRAMGLEYLNLLDLVQLLSKNKYNGLHKCQ